jgi:hypothetical protein
MRNDKSQQKLYQNSLKTDYLHKMLIQMTNLLNQLY